MMEQQYKPVISVLMTVYNAGEELRTCLDSIMHQSYQDFEVIAVNNGSTDMSMEILEEYRDKYPEKVFVYSIPHSDFVGTGRNYALSKARGEYIYICDADDMVERDALIFLHARAEHYNSDVVYGYSRFVNMQSRTYFFAGHEKERDVHPGELILSGADYWRRLYKKALLDKVIKEVGPIPENTNFDDVAWLPVVHSYAEKIHCADRIIYNYFRRTSSAVGGFSPDIVRYSIISENYAMENCNPKYKDYVELYAARRIDSNLTNRWIYTDFLIEHIKNNWNRFKKNPHILNDSNLYHKLEKYNSLSDTPIDKRVYLDNFDNGLSEDFISHVRENAFDECEIVILDNSNCNMDELEKNNIPIECAKEYFVLKHLYEFGGVYINRNVILDRPLNSLRYCKAFFGFVDRDNFSDSLFGAQKNSAVIKSILDTYYNSFYNSKGFSLASRIKNILNVKYEIPLNADTNLFDYEAAVLAPDVICYNPYYGIDVPSFFHICCHSFEEQKEEDKHLYVTIKNTSLRTLYEKHYSNLVPATTNTSCVNADIINQKEFFETRVKNIEQSSAYKLALKIYDLGNKGFFKYLKGFVKKLLLRE